jgi:KDO2-lipid IV(A) lauroyltransferase
LLPLAFRLGARLPLPLLHAIGALCGWLAFLADGVYRRRMVENLRRSGVADGRVAQRRMIVRAAAEAGKAVFELPVLWCAPPARIAGLVRAVRGAELLDRAERSGRGLFLLTPHLGAFEAIPQWYAQRRPITIMYRAPRSATLDALMRAGRNRGGIELVAAEPTGVRSLMRRLRAGGTIGLLPDQAPGAGEGVWVEFFGRPAYTMTLAARLARSTRASVVFAFARRLARGRGYELEFVELPGPWPEDLAAGTRRVNELAERLIRSCPEQYLWSYHRYKAPAGAPPAPAAAGSVP